MNQQEDHSGFSPGSYGVPAPYHARVSPAAAVPPHVRPLSTGEILDRTFTLYRRRFWLFVGIGMLPAIFLTLSSVARMVYLATHHLGTAASGSPATVLADTMSSLARMQLYFLPATVLFVIAYGISHAAVVDAVGKITQAFPVSVGQAYQAVRGKWMRWTGVALRQLWAFLWPMLLAFALLGASFLFPAVRGNNMVAASVFLTFSLLAGCGVVLGVFNVLRVALAIPAAVQENLRVNAAMRRSRDLVAGRKGRIFLALLLMYALQLVAGGVQAPLLWLATTTRGAEQIMLQAIDLAVQFAATALVSPIASIALCLFYIDERVRREGYDIELLMRRRFAASGDELKVHEHV